jgi:hypothetical protein
MVPGALGSVKTVFTPLTATLLPLETRAITPPAPMLIGYAVLAAKGLPGCTHKPPAPPPDDPPSPAAYPPPPPPPATTNISADGISELLTVKTPEFTKV